MNEKSVKRIHDFLEESFSRISLGYYVFFGGGCADEAAGFDDDMSYLMDEVGANSIEYGCTKMVLSFNDISDYVVKIPFMGYCDENDVCEYYSNDEFKYNDMRRYFFKNVPVSGGWDYCKYEEKLYSIAQKRGCESCFAKTFFIGFLKNKYPIYLSKKVVCDEDSISSIQSENKEKLYTIKKMAKDNKVYFESKNGPDIFEKMMGQYGKKTMESLIKFIHEYRIQDLHEGNFGIDNDGRIKIIDYSGYMR